MNSALRAVSLGVAVALSLAACQSAASTGAPLAAAPSGLAQVPLTIAGHGASHRFTVEVAASPAEQEKGLMFRESLAPDRGMIFPLARVDVATFWMKNTLIPLDMVFIRADGTIARVAANAVPMTLDVVSSEEPVSAVLELAGGRAAELGIRPGDRVRWPH
ncbi:MAG: DUF192 domain-containing protein [Sphingomicrobium sp.]|nr:DUF192 domain-containing protein [Sphingomonadales bacterium]